MYGVDLMIEENYNVKLLEINFSPDITRACWDSNFVSNMLTLLFLNKNKESKENQEIWNLVTKL